MCPQKTSARKTRGRIKAGRGTRPWRCASGIRQRQAGEREPPSGVKPCSNLQPNSPLKSATSFDDSLEAPTNAANHSATEATC